MALLKSGYYNEKDLSNAQVWAIEQSIFIEKANEYKILSDIELNNLKITLNEHADFMFYITNPKMYREWKQRIEDEKEMEENKENYQELPEEMTKEEYNNYVRSKGLM